MEKGFPGTSDSKEFACNAGDPGSLPGLGRSPGDGHGYPLQYSCLDNPMDRGAWWAIVPEVTKSWTWLSKFHFHLIERGVDPTSVAMMTTRGQTRACLELCTLSPPSRGGGRKGKVISFCWEVWCETSSWRCWCFCCFWDPVRAWLAKYFGQVCVCVCVCVCVGMSEVIVRDCGLL